MKYVLMFVCFAFGTAYAAQVDYICLNYGGTIDLKEHKIYTGGSTVRMKMTLTVKGNSIDVEDEQFKGTCEHKLGMTSFLAVPLGKDVVDCMGKFTIEGEDETFDLGFSLDKALLEGAPQGQFYRMGHDQFLVFNCHQG